MICICFVFLSAQTVLIPNQSQKAHAEAITIAVAGTAVSATAVYVLGALAVGTLAAGVGLTYGDEINAHAKEVWGTASTAVKEGFADALAASKNGYVKLDGAVRDWFKSATHAITNNSLVTRNGNSSVFPYAPANVTSTLIGSANSFAFNANFYGSTLGNYKVVVTNPNVNNIVVHGSINIQLYHSGRLVISGSNNETYKIDLGIGDVGNAVLFGLSSATTLQGMLNVINKTTHLKFAVMHVDNINNYYDSVLNNLSKVFGSTLSLNLPADNLYLPRTDDGQTLKKNPDGALVLPNGQTYTGEVGYTLPGLKVLDVDGIKVPAIPLSIPGYYVNVTTGEVIKITGTTTDIDFPIGSVVPPSTVPADPTKPPKEPKKLNFDPLMIVGDKLKTKFPFSIPFDFVSQFSVFDVKPDTPVVNINRQGFVNIGGKSMDLNFQIDFSMFNQVAAITRWALIIIFDIALILAIRRLMPE